MCYAIYLSSRCDDRLSVMTNSRLDRDFDPNHWPSH